MLTQFSGRVYQFFLEQPRNRKVVGLSKNDPKKILQVMNENLEGIWWGRGRNHPRMNDANRPHAMQ